MPSLRPANLSQPLSCAPGALGFLLGAALSAACLAESIRALEVTSEDDGSYRTRADVVLDAPVAAVWERLTDLAHLERISPTIEASRVLGVTNDAGYVVHTTARACVLLFCKRMQQVQTVWQPEPGRMHAELDPARSDFAFGRASWRLEPDGEATHLWFEAQLRPAFWVPPLIGGWLLERTLRQEVEGSARNLERLAQGPGG